MLAPALFAIGLATTSPAGARTTPPKSFAAEAGADADAIRNLLNTYTLASSTHDEALFRSLLLNDQIPISDADAAIAADGRPHGLENYRNFRRGFEGSPSRMTFERIRVEMDGPLAQVSLVFRKTMASGSSWGLKSLQLIKLDGRWKIASELFTYHPLSVSAVQAGGALGHGGDADLPHGDEARPRRPAPTPNRS